MLLSWLLSRRFVKQLANTVSDDVKVAQNSGTGFQTGWEKFANGIENLWKGFTGSGVTQRDIELNQMSMQNVEDNASRQVEGYTKAGINPALMFSGGASSAPQASSSGSVGNMSELLQMVSLPLQLRMMKAQIDNVNANTAKTRVDTEKSGTESDEIKQRIIEAKSRIKGLDISNDQQNIILSYLDRMQNADLTIKEKSAERMDADIKQIYQHIDNLSAEECATYVSMCETVERIDLLQKQQRLTADEARYYSKLVENLNKQNKILQLQADDWDYINIVGTTSFSTGVGPFKGSESRPVTLHDLKAHAEKIGEEKARESGNKDKSWNDLKKDASDRYGALE